MKRKSKYLVESEEEDYGEQNSNWMREGKRGGGGSSGGQKNGFVLREVDVSQLPSQLLTNLVQVKPEEGGVISTEDIEADGDAWILQCPRNVRTPAERMYSARVHPHSRRGRLDSVQSKNSPVELQDLLKGKKIHLNGNPTVLNTVEDEEESLVCNEKFESTAHSRQDSGESLSLLIPDVDGRFKMVSVPLKGYIMIKKHVEELSPPDIKIPRRKMHKLPSGIKERHPIYGVDFSHASCLTKVTCSPRKAKPRNLVKDSFRYSKTTTSRLIETETASTRIRSKSKYHEKIVKEEPIWQEQEMLTPTKTKKSKKRKREEESEDLVVEVPPVKAKKTKKHNAEELEDEVFYSPSVSPQKSKKSKKSKLKDKYL